MEINILENKEEFETNFEDQDDVRLDGLGNIIRKIIGVGIREIWFDATFAICMRYICYTRKIRSESQEQSTNSIERKCSVV